MMRLPRLFPPKPPKPSERGAALLAAIFIVAMMAAAAAAVTEEIRYAVRRAQNVEARDQAYWYALGAETLARARLARAEGSQRELLEQAAAEGRALAFPIDGGTIAATLHDGQNCFNLNGLMQPGDQGYVERAGAAAEYERLLRLLGVPPARAGMLTAALLDWMDADGQARTGGAEDAAYAAADAPRRAANTTLAEVEELRAVAGYDEAVFAAIRPYVCAMSRAEPAEINVNVLRPDQAPLLAAFFGESLTPEKARDVIGGRPAAGYADVEEFRRHPRIAELRLDEEQEARLTLSSSRFILVADVTYLGARFRLESVMETAGDMLPPVAARRFGAAE